MDKDFLYEARHSIDMALVSLGDEQAMVNAQLAIACALVAMAEGQAALIEHLNRIMDYDSYVVLTK